MLSAAFTWMRQRVLVLSRCAVTESAPLLGTAVASGLHVTPPSVESKISTAEATLPPPTVQVTGKGTPDVRDSPPLGAVTTNGGPLTMTSIESDAWPPQPGWLSRTV